MDFLRRICALSAMSIRNFLLSRKSAQHYDRAHNHEDQERLPREIIKALKHLEERIMSKISDYVTAVEASFAQVNTAIDDITVGIKALNDKITQLQNSSGQISDADQALLDEGQKQAQDLAAKAEALDTFAPPTAPPAQ